MTLPELFELLKKSPEVLAELAAIGVAASVALGAIGTRLESVGVKWNLLWLERLGQRIEALGTDLPKLKSGSRYTNDILARVEAGLKRGADAGEP